MLTRSTIGLPAMVHGIRDLLSYRLAMLASLNDRSGQAHIKETFGLTLSAWRVLGNIASDEPVSFLALSKRLAIDKGQLSRTIATLTDLGLVVSAATPTDRRTATLSLTRAGRALHSRILTFAAARNDAVLSALTAAEQRNLLALLPKLERFVEREHAALAHGSARDAEATAKAASQPKRPRAVKSRTTDARTSA